MRGIVLSSKRKRPISPFTDVILGSIGFPLLIIGIFLGLDMWLQSPVFLPYPLNLSGMVFVVLGLSLASWCFKVALVLPKRSNLVTWGPWSYVRHPIYLAGLLINLGVAMTIGTWLLLLQFASYTLLEILVDAPREERNLRKIFADEYEEYSQRVPSWIPREN
jgi:protein-S-isoprenylcysteine O-methyltransferase Ste14